MPSNAKGDDDQKCAKSRCFLFVNFHCCGLLAGGLSQCNETGPLSNLATHGRSYEKQRYSISSVLGQLGEGSVPSAELSAIKSHCGLPLHKAETFTNALSWRSFWFSETFAKGSSCLLFSCIRLRQLSPQLAWLIDKRWEGVGAATVGTAAGFGLFSLICQTAYTNIMIMQIIIRCSLKFMRCGRSG